MNEAEVENADQTLASEPKKMSLARLLVVIAAAIVIFASTVVALQIDDWSRDLTTNHAATSVDAEQEWMRPIMVDLSLEEGEELIMTATQRLNSRITKSSATHQRCE